MRAAGGGVEADRALPRATYPHMLARAVEGTALGAVFAAWEWWSRASVVTNVHYGRVRVAWPHGGLAATDASGRWAAAGLVARVTTGGKVVTTAAQWRALASSPSGAMRAWVATRGPMTLVAGNPVALFRQDCGTVTGYGARAAAVGLVWAAVPSPTWPAVAVCGVLSGAAFFAVDEVVRRWEAGTLR